MLPILLLMSKCEVTHETRAVRRIHVARLQGQAAAQEAVKLRLQASRERADDLKRRAAAVCGAAQLHSGIDSRIQVDPYRLCSNRRSLD